MREPTLPDPAAAGTPGFLSAPPDTGAAIDAAVAESVAGGRLVGAVVLVARAGRLVARSVQGHADREAGVAMHERTVFRLASVSKIVTTAAALRLIDQGRLGLDDEVARWLPAFTPAGPAGQPARITVRQLLSHGAGLGDPFLPPCGADYRARGIDSGLDTARLPAAQWLAALGVAPLAAMPGRRFGYSLATDVLGEVVAASAGMAFDRALASLVAGPLALASLGFAAHPQRPPAVAYANSEAGAVRRLADADEVRIDGLPVALAPARAFDSAARPSGGAGMLGCAGDVLSVLVALQQPQFLSPSLWREFATPQFGAEAAALGPGWGFGLGAAVLLDPAAAGTGLPAGTLAWGGVYGHTWTLVPLHGLAMVALTNTTPEGANGVLARRLRQVLATESGRC